MYSSYTFAKKIPDLQVYVHVYCCLCIHTLSQPHVMNCRCLFGQKMLSCKVCVIVHCNAVWFGTSIWAQPFLSISERNALWELIVEVTQISKITVSENYNLPRHWICLFYSYVEVYDELLFYTLPSESFWILE